MSTFNSVSTKEQQNKSEPNPLCSQNGPKGPWSTHSDTLPLQFEMFLRTWMPMLVLLWSSVSSSACFYRGHFCHFPLPQVEEWTASLKVCLLWQTDSPQAQKWWRQLILDLKLWNQNVHFPFFNLFFQIFCHSSRKQHILQCHLFLDPSPLLCLALLPHSSTPSVLQYI